MLLVYVSVVFLVLLDMNVCCVPFMQQVLPTTPQTLSRIILVRPVVPNVPSTNYSNSNPVSYPVPNNPQVIPNPNQLHPGIIANIPQRPVIPNPNQLYPGIIQNIPQSPVIPNPNQLYPGIFKNIPQSPVIPNPNHLFPGIIPNIPQNPVIPNPNHLFPGIIPNIPQRPVIQNPNQLYPGIIQNLPQIPALPNPNRITFPLIVPVTAQPTVQPAQRWIFLKSETPSPPKQLLVNNRILYIPTPVNNLNT